MKRIFLFTLLSLLICLSAIADGFFSINGGRLVSPEGKPYYFIGTNLWYGPILASSGQGGSPGRLQRELDRLKSLGIDNLRVLVGADAGSRNANTVCPVLQRENGTLNDTLLVGLDRFLVELEKRNMSAVLYLTNSWDWSGGFGYYLKRTGHPDSPNASGKGYKDYVDYAAGFSRDTVAQSLFFDFIKKIVSRTNSINKKRYRDLTSIMAWQICNEPRPFSPGNLENFCQWVTVAARTIKAIDPNHLVSVGSEGIVGCEGSDEIYSRIHSADAIDYLTIHIWPVNWGWASRDNLYKSLPNVYLRSGEYIDRHLRLARKLNKPIIIEEFGYPRDKNFLQPTTSTSSRNAFFRAIFQRVEESKRSGGLLAGCNFWGWGGEGKPANSTWTPGNDYLCDPPHEPQGWYSVYDCDSSTIILIKDFSATLQ